MGARRATLLAALIALALLCAGAVAPAVSAHAVLERSDPADGEVVSRAPGHVLLEFNEPVDTTLGALRILDTRGREVGVGRVERPAPDRVVVAVDERLDPGTHTVAWRIVSADSDPLSGAFVFHVGRPGAHPAGVAAEVLDGSSGGVSVLFATWRGLEFALLLGCIGGVGAVLFVLAGAAPELRRRLLGVLAALSAALALAALPSLVLQGAAGAGTGLGAALSWDVVRAVGETRFGEAALVRAGLAATLCALALGLRSRPREAPVGLAAAMLVVAVGLAVTPGLAGHASMGGAAAFAADVAHVLAAATWVGGLAFLVLALVLARAARWRLASQSVPRFSNLAVASVAVLVVAGTVGAVVQVGAWRGLWDTTYGVLLLAKLALLVPLLALGALNNRFAVPRLRAEIASPAERARFLRATTAELGLMVLIIAVTAVLVNAPPARTEVEMHAGAMRTVALGDLRAHVAVRPASVGANEVHVMFEGRDLRIDEVTAAATLPDRGIGPIAIRLRPAGPRVYMARATLPVAGEWRLRVDALRGEFDLLSGGVRVPIREEP